LITQVPPGTRVESHRKSGHGTVRCPSDPRRAGQKSSSRAGGRNQPLSSIDGLTQSASHGHHPRGVHPLESLPAGLQGAILLISAKRADSISSEVAVHTLPNTARLQDMIEANTQLTETVAKLATEIHHHVCVAALPPPDDFLRSRVWIGCSGERTENHPGAGKSNALLQNPGGHSQGWRSMTSPSTARQRSLSVTVT
jgi:hypothetical protein